ncbi:hypothetical protein FQN54_009975 [Arachnomyces sp. PD_36]|nr:hypothetical protein FQN54_009975 [Arachnomyces sp. PD_36]
MAEAQSPPPAALLPNGNKINAPLSSKGPDCNIERFSPSSTTNEAAEREPHPYDTQENAGQEDDASVPPLPAVTADLHARVTSFLAESHDPSSLLYRVQNQTRISLSVIDEARSRYKLSELSLSYNGGKDCLVMLILFLSSLHQPAEPATYSPTSTSTSTTTTTSTPSQPTSTSPEPHPTTIPAIYALPPHPFPSVESFVLSSSLYYHLSLTRYTTSPPTTTLRSAFTSYLHLHPHIRAIFVGTRRTDPHGGSLTHFDRTDHGWPDFMRIHPVIDWHYVEIWAFIRHLGIEYCSLYDEGYTSLGGTNDTHPNPKLMRKMAAGAEAGASACDGNSNGPSSGESNGAYRPAYELMDDDEERLGRD